MCLRLTMARCGVAFVVIAFVILAPNLCGVLQRNGSTTALVSRNENRSVKRRFLTDQSLPQPGADIQIPLCGPEESCKGRCGSFANDAQAYRCFCDHRCPFFKDCCMDFLELCSENVSNETNLKEPVRQGRRPTSPPFSTEEAGNSEDLSSASLRSKLNFDCIGVEEFTDGMVWMKSTCDPRWTDSRMEEMCADVHGGDTLARLPVQGKDGFTYRNMYCAQCNWVIVDFIYWIGLSVCYEEPPPDFGTNMVSLASYLKSNCRTLVNEPRVEDVAKPRFCLQNVDWCNPDFAQEVGSEFSEFQSRCTLEYQGLVRRENDTADSTIFKNPFCALCNGVKRHEMSCDVPALSRYTSDNVSYYDYFTDVDSVNVRHVKASHPMPSYLVITNYNLRNSSNVMILKTDGSNELVPINITCPGTEVFDPYIGKCRVTYCAAGYAMSANKCVKEPHPTVEDVTLCFFNTSILMTFTITVKFTWFVDENGDITDPDDFLQPFPGNKSDEFNFTDPGSEIKMRSFVVGRGNVTWGITEILEFIGLLDQVSENSTLDHASKFWLSVLSFEVQALQVNVAGYAFNVDSSNLGDFITSLKGNTKELAGFLEQCPDGVKNVYGRDQLIVTEQSQGDCSSVRIKNTSISYYCSGWLFLESDSALDGDFTTAVVCEDYKTVLDPSCVRIRYDKSEYTVVNGTVVCSNGKRYDLGEYEEAADGGIFTCSDFDNVMDTKFVVHFNFTQAQDTIAMVGVGLSTTCLSATLITYALFKELRTLPGMNLMTLAVILLINDWTFLFGLYATDYRTTCQAVAVFLHFVCLSQFFWGNVIAYDVFKTFGRKRLTKVNLNTSQRKQYLRYALYAWGMPILIVSTSVVLDLCECTSLDVDYGMYFSCWISDPIAYSVFFGFPMLVTNAANLIMFVMTVCNLRRYHRKSAVISGNAHSQSHFALCAKLATVMGFAWNLAFFASILHNAVLWYFFFVFYFLQGFFIFLSYIFNRRVYRMYLKRFGRDRLPSSTSAVPPKERSRPPSVASHIPITPQSSRPSVSRSPSVDQDITTRQGANQLSNLGTPLDSPRIKVFRQRSNSCNCSVAHISDTNNFDSVCGSVSPGTGLLRRVSFSDGIRHLRTISVDGASYNMKTSDTYPLELGQFDNSAYSSCDDYSSDDDDVFQPAYYYTQC